METSSNNQPVVLPADDFREMQSAAFSQPSPSGGERIASSAQTFFLFATIAGAVTAGSYGWASAIDWLEERRQKRADRKNETLKSV